MRKLIELDAALEGLENLNAISFYETNEHSKEAYMETKGMLKTLPTVDAVEVVRCRDCKYWDTVPGSTFAPMHHQCKVIKLMSTGTWYCASGERKDGDHAEGAL